MTIRRFDQEDIIDRTAHAICKHGWQTPALMGLELFRPFTFLGGQILWIIQPMLSLLISAELIGQVASVLEEPESVDLLIQRLESVNS